jgi:hypothetical protein
MALGTHRVSRLEMKVAHYLPEVCPMPRNRLSPNVTEYTIGKKEDAENTDGCANFRARKNLALVHRPIVTR